VHVWCGTEVKLQTASSGAATSVLPSLKTTKFTSQTAAMPVRIGSQHCKPYRNSKYFSAQSFVNADMCPAGTVPSTAASTGARTAACPMMTCRGSRITARVGVIVARKVPRVRLE